MIADLSARVCDQECPSADRWQKRSLSPRTGVSSTIRGKAGTLAHCPSRGCVDEEAAPCGRLLRCPRASLSPPMPAGCGLTTCCSRARVYRHHACREIRQPRFPLSTRAGLSRSALRRRGGPTRYSPARGRVAEHASALAPAMPLSPRARGRVGTRLLERLRCRVSLSPRARAGRHFGAFTREIQRPLSPLARAGGSAPAIADHLVIKPVSPLARAGGSARGRHRDWA